MTLGDGAIIGDRYELGRQLGAGGMARVYLGHDRLLDRRVAVKVLSDPYASDPQFVERFRREASAAAGLNHPNIVSVYDRGETDGSYYIVMEYLPGPDLKQVVRRRAPLPAAESIDNALQILAALGAAHRRDVIHRDVKPQNIMVAEDGHLKVTDFGIARAGAQSDMTEAGSVIGTAQYLSPEQARGDEVTAASDCYSVAIVLYEMLTGRVPFDGERPVTVAMKQISEVPVPPSQLEPSVPPALEAVVLRGLAKRPSERYRTAEEFMRALLDARAQIEGATGSTRVLAGVALPPTEATRMMATPPPTEATRVSPRPTPPARTAHPPEPPPRRALWPWILGGLLVLALIVGGAFALMGGGNGGDGPGEQVTIPQLQGQPQTQAERRLDALGLIADVRTTNHPNVAQGRVVRTEPAAGRSVDSGSTVVLMVSAGPSQVEVPSVVDREQAQAQAALGRLGLNMDVVGEESHDTIPAGRVVRQNPGAGGTVEAGGTVRVWLSSGVDEVEVPDVRNATESQAREAITAAGLTVGEVTRREDATATPGTVLEQNPGPGTSVPSGSSVGLVVAVAPEAREVPSVVGNWAADAEYKLRDLAGFPVRRTEANSDTTEPGRVISQDPPAGQSVPPNTRITIVVSIGPAITSTPTVPTTPTVPPTTEAPATTAVPTTDQTEPAVTDPANGSNGGADAIPPPELP